MQSYGLVWGVLLAGVISFLNAQSQDIQIGGYFTLNTLTYTASVSKCYVISPTNETIELVPTNGADSRFELEEREPFGCFVSVQNAGAADTGTWTIHSETEDGKQFTGTSYVSVIGGDGSHVSDLDFGDKNTVWLRNIAYLTTFGNNVSITLSKQETDEECFLRSNQDKLIDLSEDVSGIRAYGPSKYVSCRVVVGPFDGTMIGTWTLCGKSKVDGGQEKTRCQRANIAWHHNSPNSAPNHIFNSELEYNVNYGLTLTPGVRGSGNVHSCNVITPAGEDIALAFDSAYPKLARVGSRSTCSVAIGPFDEPMIGNWSLYAVFTSSYMVNSVRHQPLHFYLYDESNPEAQAYNVTILDAQSRVVNLGNTAMFQASGSGRTDDCLIKTPAGQKYDLASAVGIQGISLENLKNNKTTAVCRVIIGPITEDMLGQWELAGKFSRRGMFNEIKQPFQIIKEDPSNPIEDGIERVIETLSEELVYMDIEATHRFTIPNAGSSFITYEGCHLLTPDGLQYKLMEGFNVSGVEIVEDEEATCAVEVTVMGAASVGKWVLFSRETIIGTPTEKRLPFTIAVEVQVESSAKEVTVAEGNDYHIRLQNPTELSTTCRLLRPDGTPAVEYERNENSQFCEYVVRNMTAEDSGTWAIVYGENIIYKARTEVKVVSRSDVELTSLTWNRDQSLNTTLGPEDAVYCRLVSPTGTVVFEGFGRCRVPIPRVTDDHAGVWRVSVGLPGRVLTDELDFTVNVVHAAPKAQVTVQVVKERPNVELTCSLANEEEVTSCKFRDPSGKVMLASHGVGEDRYSFHSAGTTLRSSASAHECKLSIADPVAADLGLWRCAIETANDTYYGFLTVLCPWAMQDPKVAATVVTEPTLAADAHVRAVAGDAVTMSCSVAAPIRYCYFRARNGTVYNVAPGTTGAVQYASAGFDAGECSARFSSLSATDSGAWSCHVGFQESQETERKGRSQDSGEEQRAEIQVAIEDVMTVNQTHEGNTLVIESIVHGGRSLDYCRFVRIDGVGFTSDNVILPYNSTSSLSSGRCGLQVPNPSILELHPWTVVAKVTGQDVEYSRLTESTFRGEDLPPGAQGKRRSGLVVFSMLLLSVSLSIIFVGMLLGPKKNRRWTYSKFNNFRDSFRRSSFKAPLPPYPGDGGQKTSSGASETSSP